MIDRTTPYAACATLALAGLTLIGTATGAGAPDKARFVPAQPGYRYEFPRDHGAHERFRTEWWYYTGHLRTAEGREFGFELTFFRRGLAASHLWTNPSAWSVKHLYLAHAAVSDLQGCRFRYAEKVSRSALGKAGADTGRLHVWIDRWGLDAAPSAAAPHHLKAATEQFTLDLTLTPENGPIIHGAGGVSRKGEAPGQTSHYYSVTRLATEGALIVDGTRFPVSGVSWMDHEFGSGDLGADQVGWDWFSLQLNGGGELMVYRLRRADGTADPASSGTIIHPDGRHEPLAHDEIRITPTGHWTSPASGARYPAGWRLEIPREAFVADVTPRLADQELITRKSTQVTYWEGSVAVRATWRDRAMEGHGYVELTGYAERFQLAN